MEPIFPIIFVIENTPAERFFKKASQQNSLIPGQINFLTKDEMRSLRTDVEYIYPKVRED